METPQSCGTSAYLASERTFLGIPAELRLIIYEFLFSPLAGHRHPSLVEYHFCDKTYDITEDIARFRGQARRYNGLTAILRTCQKVYDEALPLLCDHANFIIVASLRPASSPLEISSSAGIQLAQAKTVQLEISLSSPCQFAPTFEETNHPSTASRTRRASWDGESSVGTSNLTTGAPKPFAKTRRKSWACPPPIKMPTQMCLKTYLHRLESLLEGFNHNKKMRSLDIKIDNTDRRLNDQSIDTILSHMGARLRVKDKCRVELSLDRCAWSLVSHLRIARFLHDIQ